jgi:hypothetical protein
MRAYITTQQNVGNNAADMRSRGGGTMQGRVTVVVCSSLPNGQQCRACWCHQRAYKAVYADVTYGHRKPSTLLSG